MIIFSIPPAGAVVVTAVVATAVAVVADVAVVVDVVCVQLLVAQFKRMCEQQWPVVQFIYWP